MKRNVRNGLLALFVAALATGIFFLCWILFSPDMVRWLLGSVSRNSGVTLTAHTVHGGLATTIRMEGFSVLWSDGRLTVDELKIRCSPLLLLSGTLRVRELSLRTVHLQDDAPASPNGPELVWPRITGLPARFGATIDRLSVAGFTYRTFQQPPLQLPGLSAAVTWHDSRLTVANLDLAMSDGRITGTASAGFNSALLNAALLYEPRRQLAGTDRFELKTDLKPGRGDEQLAGMLTIAAFAGKKMRYSLSGDMGIVKNGLQLHAMTLHQQGRGGLVKVKGDVLFTGTARLRLLADRLDLTQELGEKTVISGTVDLQGDASRYAGQLALTSSGVGWRPLRLRGALRGSSESIELSAIDAAFMEGTIRGRLQLNWKTDLLLSAQLQGNGLNPARIDPAWKGAINLDLDGSAGWRGGALQQAQASGRLNSSMLHGKALKGELEAQIIGNDLQIDRLLLVGKGFNLKADGMLSQRLNLTADISDLAALVPKTGGSLSVKGSGRYASGIVSGSLTGQGSNLATEGGRIQSSRLALQLSDDPLRQMKLQAELSGLSYQGMRADTASIKADGVLLNHRLALTLTSTGTNVSAMLSGGYADSAWNGTLTALSGHDPVGPWRLLKPAPLSISSRSFSCGLLTLNGLPQEKIELSGQFSIKPFHGAAKVRWNGVNLARADQWLNDTRITGRSAGNLQIGTGNANSLTAAGNAQLSGTIASGNQALVIRKAVLQLDAGAQGTTASLDFQAGDAVAATARFTSSDPATVALPEHGELQATWKLLDPALLKRWIPAEIDLAGQLTGRLSGKLLPGRRFDLTGSAVLADGSGRWHDRERELKVSIRKALLDWTWQKESLNGNLTVTLARLGETRGSFRIPLSARFGSVPDPEGPLKGKLSGRFQERGLLTSLFPGLLQETKGLLEVDLIAGGTLHAPEITGSVTLSKAGAYLPTTGILLEDLQVAARIYGNRMLVETFQVRSGSGTVTGTAEALFSNFKLTGFNGTLRGERFQAVHLPELQLLVSPELSFEGNLKKLSARGRIRIPEMQVMNQESSAVVRPSSDVVVAGREPPSVKQTKTALDLQLGLLLGEKVHIKASGVDARLEGNLNIRITGLSKITGTGEIRVAKGSYGIYGAQLDIKRGRAIFSGGPVEQPSLDILALRVVDDVKAGVTVTGTPEVPLIKLYSEPVLPDTDILAYIVLGHKLDENRSQSAMLMQAASILASSKRTGDLRNQIKKLLPVDSVTIASDSSRSYGYARIDPSLSQNGTTQKTSVQQTMLQIGKYLTPKLYVSYGRSLFDETQQIKARYRFNSQWEVETKASGSATGGDLFYRIELD